MGLPWLLLKGGEVVEAFPHLPLMRCRGVSARWERGREEFTMNMTLF